MGSGFIPGLLYVVFWGLSLLLVAGIIIYRVGIWVQGLGLKACVLRVGVRLI